MHQINYGDLNGHVIGITMKELVRRAMSTIHRSRIVFEAMEKVSNTGKDQDFVTTADKAAQELYLKSLRECFPTFGILAEEDELRIECVHPGNDLYFTVDPLDGTQAFIRRQSHGIGTMIALICDREVIATFIGDVNTGEIYGYRPDSSRVHRISDLDVAEQLSSRNNKPLSEQYVILRYPPTDHSKFMERLCTSGPFKSYEIGAGSIGITFARLWKGEVGAIVLKSALRTPWDTAPILGISKKLGYLFLRYDAEANRFVDYTNSMVSKAIIGTPELIIVHRMNLNDLRTWLP